MRLIASTLLGKFRAPQTWPHQTCPVSTGPFLGSVSVFSTFRASMPAIPYLVPEFVSVCSQKFRTSFWGSSFFIFSGFCAELGFPSFPCFPPFPVFKGPVPEFRFFCFFRFFRLFRFSRVQIRNSGFSAFSAFWGSKPGIPGSRLRPRLVRPRLAHRKMLPKKRESSKNCLFQKQQSSFRRHCLTLFALLVGPTQESRCALVIASEQATVENMDRERQRDREDKRDREGA